MHKGYSIKAASAGRGEILLYGDIGEGWFGGVSAKQFAGDLKALGKVNALDVRINSFGGDVFDGLAIYRQLVDHPSVVTCYVDGIAASIASVIAMAGSDIKIAEAGELMIHNAWAVSMGPAADMRAMADRLDAVSSSIADVYCARTGLPKEQVKAWMDAETTFQSGDAVKHGFASSVMPNMRMAARQAQSPRHWRHAAPVAAVAVSPLDRPRYDASRLESNRQRASALLAKPMRAAL